MAGSRASRPVAALLLGALATLLVTARAATVHTVSELDCGSTSLRSLRSSFSLDARAAGPMLPTAHSIGAIGRRCACGQAATPP